MVLHFNSNNWMEEWRSVTWIMNLLRSLTNKINYQLLSIHFFMSCFVWKCLFVVALRVLRALALPVIMYLLDVLCRMYHWKVLIVGASHLFHSPHHSLHRLLVFQYYTCHQVTLIMILVLLLNDIAHCTFLHQVNEGVTCHLPLILNVIVVVVNLLLLVFVVA